MRVHQRACRDFLAEFSSFVDGSLNSAHRARLLAHLDCCEACLRHLRAYRNGIAIYRRATVPAEPGWDFYDRLIERLEEEPRLLPVESRQKSSGSWSSRLQAAALAATTAIALLVVPPTWREISRPADQTAAEPSAGDRSPTSYATVGSDAGSSLAPRADIAQRSGHVATVGQRRARALRSQAVPLEVQLAEVPRRQVRIVPVDDSGSWPIHAGTWSGPAETWPGRTGTWPARAPVTIDQSTSMMPATWVAEAALRIP